jgi:hypothetical protein
MNSTQSSQWTWPQCPQCGLRRTTVCPACNTAGNHFQQGDFVDAVPWIDSRSGQSRNAFGTLLLCPTCDEPFAARFYRYCPGCGFDFGSGVEVNVPDSAFDSEFNVRVVAVLLGVVSVVAVVLGYFRWILS